MILLTNITWLIVHHSAYCLHLYFHWYFFSSWKIVFIVFKSLLVVAFPSVISYHLCFAAYYITLRFLNLSVYSIYFFVYFNICFVYTNKCKKYTVFKCFTNVATLCEFLITSLIHFPLQSFIVVCFSLILYYICEITFFHLSYLTSLGQPCFR